MTLYEAIRNLRSVYKGDMVHYFRIVFYEAKNLTNPYHNFRHMMHVFWRCYTACVYYQKRGQLTRTQMRILLIAAIFHDFDHGGRTGHDYIEVARSIREMRKHLLPKDLRYADEIEALMQSTEYPHKIAAEDLSLSGQILRDADVTQAISDAWLQQVVFGLAEESEVTPLQMLRMQLDFNPGLITDWAKEEIGLERLAAKKTEAQELLSLLEA